MDCGLNIFFTQPKITRTQYKSATFSSNLFIGYKNGAWMTACHDDCDWYHLTIDYVAHDTVINHSFLRFFGHLHFGCVIQTAV